MKQPLFNTGWGVPPFASDAGCGCEDALNEPYAVLRALGGDLNGLHTALEAIDEVCDLVGVTVSAREVDTGVFADLRVLV